MRGASLSGDTWAAADDDELAGVAVVGFPERTALDSRTGVALSGVIATPLGESDVLPVVVERLGARVSIVLQEQPTPAARLKSNPLIG